MTGPERLRDLLPSVLADLAARHQKGTPMSDPVDPLVKQLAERLIAEQNALLAAQQPGSVGVRIADTALGHLAAALVPAIRAAAKDAVHDEIAGAA